MTKPTWLRSLLVPVVILFTLFSAFAVYYLYWVPNRQRHLDDRGFRYLKTLSDQIRLTLNSFDKMLDNASGSGIVGATDGVTEHNLKEFLRYVAPQLIVPDDSETAHVIGGDYDDPPKIAVKADEGTHFLYLAFSQDQETKGKAKPKPFTFAVRTDLDKLINGLLGPPSLSPFDVVLVAQSDGKVIFQKSLSGIEVAQIKNLKDASGEAKEEAEKRIGIELLSPTSRLEEVKIAGARYRLYSQPMQVGFFPANPNSKSAERNQSPKGGAGNPSEKSTKAKTDSVVSEGQAATGVSDLWVVCGLVRADRFRSESQLIPYFYILMILAAILLAAASYPFLRLYLSFPGERLRARDVTITAVFACLLAVIMTFILADIYYWNFSFGPSAEADMDKLAKAMNANFRREQDAALAELDKLNKTDDLREAMEFAEAHVKQPIYVRYSGSEDACYPSWGCKVDILNDGTMFPLLERYPYPFYAHWSDSAGEQRIKWTTRQRPTPFLNLDDPSVPYYPNVKRALKKKADSQDIPTQGIGSQYSPTTGQNITTFWTVMPSPTKEDKKQDKKENKKKDKKLEEGEDKNKPLYSAALVTQPISLYRSVLPGGYQFAVVTPDGGVVFHTDTARNLRENFFAESDQNPDLRSRVRMRAAGPVTANYMGRPHRMYVLPMAAGNQDGLWAIVIFRDLHLEEVMNLEILSLVSILFILYGAAITLVILCVHWARREQATRMWYWPDSRKAKSYVQVAIANLISMVLLAILSRFVSAVVLLFCAALIPAAVMLLNMVVLGWQDDRQASTDEPDETTSTGWQTAYFAACATLLVVVAVLPCLCFFKVAADFEHRLFLEQTQLRLAADLENRALAVQALYRDVLLGEHENDVLAGAEGQHAGELEGEQEPPPESKPFFSYHELLSTTVCRGEGRPADVSGHPEETLPNCHAAGLEPEEYSILSAISFSYNERAADDRHLAEGTSDIWKWSLSPSGRTRILRLTTQEPKQTKQEASKQALMIASFWTPYQIPWDHWSWWLSVLVFLASLYGLVRLSLSRMFLLNLVAPLPAKDFTSGLAPASLMADLPVNILVIGPESSRTISSLLHRLDVQVYELEELLRAVVTEPGPAGTTEASKPAGDQFDEIVRNGQPLVLHGFERVPDDDQSAAKVHGALMRVVSRLGNSVILVSSVDPLLIPSIESSERWRTLLRTFVRIDLQSTGRQRMSEPDADYQGRISAESYFHWLLAGLPKFDKLVMLQLAQENTVNPSSSEIVYDLMEQGMIERSWGLLEVRDKGFAKFLKHAIPNDRVKHWEKLIAETRPFSLQTVMAILGIGIVAFLIYTQGEVFNTWVTYVTGAAAAVPKILQVVDSVRPKTGAKT